MASFLVRALRLPATSRDYFTDDERKPARSEYQRLAAAGVTGGCATGRFCPGAAVPVGRWPPSSTAASETEALRLRALVLLGILLAACGGDPTISATAIPPMPRALSALSVSLGAPSGGPSPSERVIPGLALPQPGPAFDAATLLDAMRTSRRPGGVPDQLETAIAATLAETLWTYGGEPWGPWPSGLMWHGDLLARSCGYPPGPAWRGSLGVRDRASTGSLTVASASVSYRSRSSIPSTTFADAVSPRAARRPRSGLRALAAPAIRRAIRPELPVGRRGGLVRTRRHH